MNPTLESHTSNVKLKSHILQLNPNNLPNFTALTYKEAGSALAHWLVTCKIYDVKITTHTTYLHLRDVGNPTLMDNLEKVTPLKQLAITNPTLESHTSNVRLKSHT